MSLQTDYYRVNELLERRILQLHKRGDIVMNEHTADFLLNRDRVNDDSLYPAESLMYSLVTMSVPGITETVQSSEDWLVRDLYELCKLYRRSHEAEGHRRIVKHFDQVQAEERKAYAKIEHMRFRG